MKHLIVIEETATSYSAYAPDVPGRIATGRARDEVEREMKAAGHRSTTVVVDDPSWLNGPPYAVVEVVFDEDDLAGCYRTEAEMRTAQGD